MIVKIYHIPYLLYSQNLAHTPESGQIILLFLTKFEKNCKKAQKSNVQLYKESAERKDTCKSHHLSLAFLAASARITTAQHSLAFQLWTSLL